jgi:hypothetical protein
MRRWDSNVEMDVWKVSFEGSRWIELARNCGFVVGDVDPAGSAARG